MSHTGTAGLPRPEPYWPGLSEEGKGSLRKVPRFRSSTATTPPGRAAARIARNAAQGSMRWLSSSRAYTRSNTPGRAQPGRVGPDEPRAQAVCCAKILRVV
jgi:hypothetical protein